MAGRRSAVARALHSVRSLGQKAHQGGPGTQQTTSRPPTCTGEVKNTYQERIANVISHVRSGSMVAAYQAIRYAANQGVDSVFKKVFDGGPVSKTPAQQASRELSRKIGEDLETRIKDSESQGGGGGGGETTPPEDEDKQKWATSIGKTMDRLQGTSAEELMSQGVPEGEIFQASYLDGLSVVRDMIHELTFMSSNGKNADFDEVAHSVRALTKNLSLASAKLVAAYGGDFKSVFHNPAKNFQNLAREVLDFLTASPSSDDLPDNMEKSLSDMAKTAEFLTDILHAQDSAVRLFSPSSLGVMNNAPAISMLSEESLSRTLLSNESLPSYFREELADSIATANNDSLLRSVVEVLNDNKEKLPEGVGSAVTSIVSSPSPTPAKTGISVATDGFTIANDLRVEAIKAAADSGDQKAAEIAQILNNFSETISSAATDRLTHYTPEKLLTDIITATAKKTADQDKQSANKDTDSAGGAEEDPSVQQELMDQVHGQALDLYIGGQIKNLSDMTVLDTLGSTAHHSTMGSFVNNPDEAVSPGSILAVSIDHLRQKSEDPNISPGERAAARESLGLAEKTVEALIEFRALRDSFLLPDNVKATIAFSDSFQKKNPGLTPAQGAVRLAAETAALRRLETTKNDISRGSSDSDSSQGEQHSESLAKLDKVIHTLKKKVMDAAVSNGTKEDQALAQFDQLITEISKNVRAKEQIEKAKTELKGIIDNERGVIISPATQAEIASGAVSPAHKDVELALNELDSSLEESAKIISTSIEKINAIADTEKSLRSRIIEASTKLKRVQDLLAASNLSADRKGELTSQQSAFTETLNTLTNELHAQIRERESNLNSIDTQLKFVKHEKGNLAETLFALRSDSTPSSNPIKYTHDDRLVSIDHFFNGLPSFEGISGTDHLRFITEVRHRQILEADIQKNEASLGASDARMIKTRDTFNGILQGTSDFDQVTHLMGLATSESIGLTHQARQLAHLTQEINKKSTDLEELRGELESYHNKLSIFKKSHSFEKVGTPSSMVVGLNNDLLLAGDTGNSWVKKYIQHQANTYADNLRKSSTTLFDDLARSYGDVDSSIGSDERTIIRNNFGRSVPGNAYDMSAISMGVRLLLDTSTILPGQGGTAPNFVYDAQTSKDLHAQTRALYRQFRNLNDSKITPDQTSASAFFASRKEVPTDVIGRTQMSDVDLSFFYGLGRSATVSYEDTSRYNAIAVTGAFSVNKGDAMSPQALKEITGIYHKLKMQVMNLDKRQSYRFGEDSDHFLIKAIGTLETLLRNQDTMAEVQIISHHEASSPVGKISADINNLIKQSTKSLSDSFETIRAFTEALGDTDSLELNKLVLQLFDKSQIADTTHGYGALIHNQLMRNNRLINSIGSLTTKITRSNPDDSDQTSIAKKEISKAVDRFLLNVATLNTTVDSPHDINSLTRRLLEDRMMGAVRTAVEQINRDPSLKAAFMGIRSPLGQTLNSTNDLIAAYRGEMTGMLRSGDFDQLNQLIRSEVERSIANKDTSDTVLSWFDGTHEYHQTDKDGSKSAMLTHLLNNRSQTLLVSLTNGDLNPRLVYPPLESNVPITFGGDASPTSGRVPDSSILGGFATDDRAKRILGDLKRGMESEINKLYEKGKEPYKLREDLVIVEQLIKDADNVTPGSLFPRLMSAGDKEFKSFNTERILNNLTNDIRRLKLNVTQFEESVYSLSGNVLRLIINSPSDTPEIDGLKMSAKKVDKLRKELLQNRLKLDGLKPKADSQEISAVRERMGEITREFRDHLIVLRSFFNINDNGKITNNINNLSKLVQQLYGTSGVTADRSNGILKDLSDTHSKLSEISNLIGVSFKTNYELSEKIVGQLDSLIPSEPSTGEDGNTFRERKKNLRSELNRHFDELKQTIEKGNDTSQISERITKTIDDYYSDPTKKPDTDTLIKNFIDEIVKNEAPGTVSSLVHQLLNKDFSQKAVDTDAPVTIRDIQIQATKKTSDTIIETRINSLMTKFRSIALNHTKDDGSIDPTKIREITDALEKFLLTDASKLQDSAVIKTTAGTIIGDLMSGGDRDQMSDATRKFLSIYSRDSRDLYKQVLDRIVEDENTLIKRELETIPSDDSIRSKYIHDNSDGGRTDVDPNDVANILAEVRAQREDLKNRSKSLQKMLLIDPTVVTKTLKRLGYSEDQIERFNNILSGEMKVESDPVVAINNSLNKFQREETRKKIIEENAQGLFNTDQTNEEGRVALNELFRLIEKTTKMSSLQESEYMGLDRQWNELNRLMGGNRQNRSLQGIIEDAKKSLTDHEKLREDPTITRDKRDQLGNIIEKLKKSLEGVRGKLEKTPTDKEKIGVMVSYDERRKLRNEVEKSDKTTKDTYKLLDLVSNLSEHEYATSSQGLTRQHMQNVEKLSQHLAENFQTIEDTTDPLFQVLERVNRGKMNLESVLMFMRTLNETTTDLLDTRNLHFHQSLDVQAKTSSNKDADPQYIIKAQAEEFFNQGFIESSSNPSEDPGSNFFQQQKENEGLRNNPSHRGAKQIRTKIDPESITSPFSKNKMEKEDNQIRDFLKYSEEIINDIGPNMVLAGQLSSELFHQFRQLHNEITKKLDRRMKLAGEQKFIEKVFLVTDTLTNTTRLLQESQFRAYFPMGMTDSRYTVAEHERIPTARKDKYNMNADQMMYAVRTLEFEIKEAISNYQVLRAQVVSSIIKNGGFEDNLAILKKDIAETRSEDLTPEGEKLVAGIGVLMDQITKRIGMDPERDTVQYRNMKRLLQQLLSLNQGFGDGPLVETSLVSKIWDNDGNLTAERATPILEKYGDNVSLLVTKSFRELTTQLAKNFSEELPAILVGNIANLLSGDPQGGLFSELRRVLTKAITDKQDDAFDKHTEIFKLAKDFINNNSFIHKDSLFDNFKNSLDYLVNVEDGSDLRVLNNINSWNYDDVADDPAFQGLFAALRKDIEVNQVLLKNEFLKYKKLTESFEDMDTKKQVSMLIELAKVNEHVAHLLTKIFMHDGVHRYHGVERETLVKAQTDIETILTLNLDEKMVADLLDNQASPELGISTIPKSVKDYIAGLLAASDMHDKVAARMSDPNLSIALALSRTNDNLLKTNVLDMLGESLNQTEWAVLAVNTPGLVRKDRLTYDDMKEAVDKIMTDKDADGRTRSLDETINRIITEINPSKDDIPLFMSVLMAVVKDKLQNLPVITATSMTANTEVKDAVSNLLVDIACSVSAMNSAGVAPSVSSKAMSTPNQHTIAFTTHQIGDSGVAVTVHNSSTGSVDHYMLSKTFESEFLGHSDDPEVNFDDSTGNKALDNVVFKSGKELVELLAGISPQTEDGSLVAVSMDSDLRGDMKSWLPHLDSYSSGQLSKHVNNESNFVSHEGTTALTVDVPVREQSSIVNAHQIADIFDQLKSFDTELSDIASVYKRLAATLTASANERLGVSSATDFANIVKDGSFFNKASKSKTSPVSDNTADDSPSRTTIKDQVDNADTPEKLAYMVREALASFNLAINNTVGRIQARADVGQAEKKGAALIINQGIRALDPTASRFSKDLPESQEAHLMENPLFNRNPDNVMVVNSTRTREDQDRTLNKLQNVIDNYYALQRLPVPTALKKATSIPSDFFHHMVATLESETKRFEDSTGAVVRTDLLAEQSDSVIKTSIERSLEQGRIKLKHDWHPNMRAKLDNFFAKLDEKSMEGINSSDHLREAVREMLGLVDPMNTPISGNLDIDHLDSHYDAIQKLLGQQIVSNDNYRWKNISRKLNNRTSTDSNLSDNDKAFLEEYLVINPNTSLPLLRKATGMQDDGPTAHITTSDLINALIEPEGTNKKDVHDAIGQLIHQNKMVKMAQLAADLNTLVSTKGHSPIFNAVLDRWKRDGVLSDDAFKYLHILGPKTDIPQILATVEEDSYQYQILEQVGFLKSMQESINQLPKDKFGDNGYDIVTLHENHASPKEIAHAMNYEARINPLADPHKSMRVIREATRLMDIASLMESGNLGNLYREVQSGAGMLAQAFKQDATGTQQLIPISRLLNKISDAEIARLIENGKSAPEPIKKLINILINKARKETKKLREASVSTESINKVYDGVINSLTLLHHANVRVSMNSTEKDNPLDQAISHMAISEKATLKHAIEAVMTNWESIKQQVFDRTPLKRSDKGKNYQISIDSGTYSGFINSVENVLQSLPSGLGKNIAVSLKTFEASSINVDTVDKLSANQAQTLLVVRQVYGGPSALAATPQVAHKAIKDAVDMISRVHDLIYQKMRGLTTDEQEKMKAAGLNVDLDPRLAPLLRRINNRENDPDGRIKKERRSLSPQEHLMIRGLLSQDQDISSAISAARDALKILGADTALIGRKQRQNSIWDSGPDSLPLQTSPLVQVVDELSKALYALEANFDRGHILQQIQDEIDGLPQSQLLEELNNRVGESIVKYKLNPAHPHSEFRAVGNIDNPGEIDHEQHKRDMENLAVILGDMVDLAPNGAGIVTRHDFFGMLKTVEGIKDVLVLAANLPSILEKIQNTNDGLDEMNAVIHQIGSITARITPDVSSKTLNSTMKKAREVSLDQNPENDFNEGSPITYQDQEDIKSRLDAGMPDSDTKADLSKGEQKSLSNISSPVVKAVEAEDRLLKTAAKTNYGGSKLGRLTRLGRLMSEIRNESDNIDSKFVLPFLEGSGADAATVSMIRSWMNLRKIKKFDYSAKADHLMELHFIKTYGLSGASKLVNAVKKVRKSENPKDFLSELEALGLKNILSKLGEEREQLDANGQVISRSWDFKLPADREISEHATDLAARSYFAHNLSKRLEGPDSAKLLENSEENSARLLNIIGRHMPDGQTTTGLLGERTIELGILKNIIESNSNEQDVKYATARAHTLGKQYPTEEAHIAAIMNTNVAPYQLGNPGDLEKARKHLEDRAQERAQDQLNKIAEGLGVKAPEFNWSWVNERLSAENADPATKVIMELAREHLPDHATSEDVAVAFTTVASVLDLHDLAFPSNNSYTQKLYGKAIKQSQGSFFHDKLREFVNSPIKQQQAYARLAESLREHSMRMDEHAEARADLTDMQLSALINSTPTWKITKGGSGKLSALMGLKDVHGEDSTLKVRDSHLTSPIGAKIGLNIDQVMQVNYAFDMGGNREATALIKEFIPTLNDQDLSDIMGKLRSVITSTNDVLIPMKHLASFSSSSTQFDAIVGAISSGSKTNALSMINGLLDRLSGASKVTKVEFSGKHLSPEVGLNNVSETTLFIPYTMVGKPTDYTDKTERTLMHARIEGFIDAFTDFSRQQESTIKLYDKDVILKEIKKQYKKIDSRGTKKATSDQTVASLTEKNLIVEAQNQALSVLSKDKSVTGILAGDPQVVANRREAIQDAIDSILHDNQGFDKAGVFADYITDIFLATQGTTSLHSLMDFTRNHMTDEQIEKSLPDQSPISKVFLENKKLKKYFPDSIANEKDSSMDALVKELETMGHLRKKLTQVIQNKALFIDFESSGDLKYVKGLQEAMKETDTLMKRISTEKYKLEKFAEVWDIASRMAEEEGLVDVMDTDSDEYITTVKDNFEKMSGLLGAMNTELTLHADPETIENERARLEEEEADLMAERETYSGRIEEWKDQNPSMDLSLLDDKSYNTQLKTILTAINRKASRIQNRVSLLTDNVSPDHLKANPQMTQLFDNIIDGGLSKYLDPVTAQRFKNLGFGQMVRNGQPLTLTGPQKYKTIIESVLNTMNNTTDLYELESLELKLEQIREAVSFLGSLTKTSKELSATEIRMLNRWTNDYMLALAA